MNVRVLLALVATVALTSACTKKDDAAAGSSSFTLSGKVASTTGSALAITDYKLYCVTFNASPSAGTSAFGSDGAFSLQLPKNTPYGCFVNAISTNLPVATFIVDGSGSGFGNTDQSTMSMSGDVSLGDLTLDLTNNKVVVPAPPDRLLCHRDLSGRGGR